LDVKSPDQKQPQHRIQSVVHADKRLINYTLRLGSGVPIDELGPHRRYGRLGPRRKPHRRQHALLNHALPALSIESLIDLGDGRRPVAHGGVQRGPMGMTQRLHAGVIVLNQRVQ
jgi:hypothetical protein